MKRLPITELLRVYNLNRSVGSPKKTLQDIADEVFPEINNPGTRRIYLYLLDNGKSKDIKIDLKLFAKALNVSKIEWL